MKVLSLFDGMSCGQIALKRARIPVDEYYASEIDKFAIGVTQHNFPKTIQVGDITALTAGDLPKIDLLIGGSPCQGFSIAKNGRLNFDDERSALFFEYVRLKNELKPKYFMLENVHMDLPIREKITELMGVEPVAINSGDFSAQTRPRLYWTNIPVKRWKVKNKTWRDIVENGDHPYKRKVNCILATIHKENVKSMVKRKKWGFLVEGEDGLPRKITPLECERAQTVPDNYTATASKTQRYRMLGNGWTVDVIAHILKGMKDG